MKSKYNPVTYMLSIYKQHYNSHSEYDASFFIHDERMEYRKLFAFCKSLSSIMELNNISYSINENEKEKKIDLFFKDTLLVTYETNLFETIRNENSLKFQFLVEWGILLELNNKKQLLIAL